MHDKFNQQNNYNKITQMIKNSDFTEENKLAIDRCT